MTSVLTILKISRETWNSIPKRDRDRIITACKKGAYDKAREIARAVLKRKSKSKKRARIRQKKKVEWWA